MNATWFSFPLCPCFARKTLPTRVPSPNKFNAGVFMPVFCVQRSLHFVCVTHKTDSWWVNMLNLAWDPEMSWNIMKWESPRIGVSQNGWFISRKIPWKLMNWYDLGVLSYVRKAPFMSRGWRWATCASFRRVCTPVTDISWNLEWRWAAWADRCVGSMYVCPVCTAMQCKVIGM